jgi:hypothetical protein
MTRNPAIHIVSLALLLFSTVAASRAQANLLTDVVDGDVGIGASITHVEDELRYLDFNFDTFTANNLHLKTVSCVYSKDILWEQTFSFPSLNLCAYANIADALSWDRSPSQLQVSMVSLVTGKAFDLVFDWQPNQFGVWDGISRTYSIATGALRPSGDVSFLGTMTLTFKDPINVLDLYLPLDIMKLKDVGPSILISKVVMVFTPTPANPQMETDVHVLLYAPDSNDAIYELEVTSDYNPLVYKDHFHFHVDGS